LSESLYKFSRKYLTATAIAPTTATAIALVCGSKMRYCTSGFQFSVASPAALHVPSSMGPFRLSSFELLQQGQPSQEKENNLEEGS
jgi:hypothetical protein